MTRIRVLKGQAIMRGGSTATGGEVIEVSAEEAKVYVEGGQAERVHIGESGPEKVTLKRGSTVKKHK